MKRHNSIFRAHPAVLLNQGKLMIIQLDQNGEMRKCKMLMAHLFVHGESGVMDDAAGRDSTTNLNRNP
jgi:hypothetical protein